MKKVGPFKSAELYCIIMLLHNNFGHVVMLTGTDLIISDKQQKGSFYINGYSAELVSNLRKDSKKSCCFEMNAPGRRSYQVCLPSFICHFGCLVPHLHY